MIKEGCVFGRLTVLCKDDSKKTKRKRHFLCQCSCGNIVSVRSDCLSRGIIQSCKCLRSELIKERAKTHGESKTYLYKKWSRMKYRCKTHKEYVKQGITVCYRWLCYENFKEDMLKGFYPSLTIDRIDNSLGYSPDNCRWATVLQQARNKTTKRLSIELVRHAREANSSGESLSSIATRLGIHPMTVYDAVKRKTWADV